MDGSSADRLELRVRPLVAGAGASVAELVLHVRDLETVVAFWTGALDQEPERPEDRSWASFTLAPGIVLLLLPPQHWEQGAGGLHLGLVAGPDGAYVQRLVDLGAEVVGTTGKNSIVLTSPEGPALVVHGR